MTGAERDGALRIAYLGSSASPHNRRWTQYLSQKFDLRMFSMEPEEIDGVDIRHFPRRTGTFLDYVMAAPRISREIAAFQPDIIHAHRVTSYGYIAMRAMKISQAPGIISVWGEDIFSFPRRSPLHRWFTTRILTAASQILSTSHVMKQETLKYVEPDQDIAVTPFGVDTSRFTPNLARRTSQQSVTVVTVKKLRPRYGVDVLIRAWAEARREVAADIDLRLEIIGEGPQRQELEELADNLGVSSQITFRGRIPHEEVPGALAQADIFAALSVTDDESFGVAMVEASAAGLPVVSSRVGGIPEVVKDGETGILIPPGDTAAAAEAIARLAQDADLRGRLGSAGRNYVLDRYDWTANAAHMGAIYHEVNSRGR
mgnify:CR=1 FL=1